MARGLLRISGRAASVVRGGGWPGIGGY